jgi:hypothetical protein
MIKMGEDNGNIILKEKPINKVEMTEIKESINNTINILGQLTDIVENTPAELSDKILIEAYERYLVTELVSLIREGYFWV